MFELSHWSDDDLARFLRIRQEFFLDPMGSNKERFLDGAMLLQRALFEWYLQAPGKFEGMLSLVEKQLARWSELRKEEQRTLHERRFALNSPAPDIPAVESGVSANQWQRIFGSLGLGLGEPGTFDRFLVQLDEETNPSLRINHRYMGELLPHDNMISYFSSVLATFLNENAIIGKVSPCVTHMEEAAVRWLLTLVGWDGGFRVRDDAATVPLQRLPTIWAPNQEHEKWTREEPTGTVVAGGTLANVSALSIARSAVLDYLLGWDGAVQSLGVSLAWDCVRAIWKYKRMVVVTSIGTHYSISKAALHAGLPTCNVFELEGSNNPWILDAPAVDAAFAKPEVNDPDSVCSDDLVIAVVLVAGKTEHGYVDRIQEIARHLDESASERRDKRTKGPSALPSLDEVVETVFEDDTASEILSEKATASGKLGAISDFLVRRHVYHVRRQQFDGLAKMRERAKKEKHNELCDAGHNRLFMHVDAAHGGGYLTVPHLRHGEFAGIEHADTITIDGHKSLYCYYPCGGLLIRSSRWARTLTTGKSEYISEEANFEQYTESRDRFRRLADGQKAGYVGMLIPPSVVIKSADRNGLRAEQDMIGRTIAHHSELGHQPFKQYLEGSRGPQGIMQLYYNLATLGLKGYRSILEWTYLLRQRCEEAVSLGLSDLRPVTDRPFYAYEPPTEAPTVTPKLGAICDSTADMRAHDEAVRSTDDRILLTAERVMPVAGGRFLRLSAGSCNQILMTYVPAREAKLIATGDAYWTRSRVRKTMRFLWRVNEFLWNEHLYANATFTYYVGHTPLELRLPARLSFSSSSPHRAPSRKKKLAQLLAGWNRWAGAEKPAAFFRLLAADVAEAEREGKRMHGKTVETLLAQSGERASNLTTKFYCHKLIITHPYTDESLLGDMLRRVAFWGEQSAADVRVADAAAKLRAEPPAERKRRKRTSRNGRRGAQGRN